MRERARERNETCKRTYHSILQTFVIAFCTHGVTQGAVMEQWPTISYKSVFLCFMSTGLLRLRNCILHLCTLQMLRNCTLHLYESEYVYLTTVSLSTSLWMIFGIVVHRNIPVDLYLIAAYTSLLPSTICLVSGGLSE